QQGHLVPHSWNQPARAYRDGRFVGLHPHNRNIADFWGAAEDTITLEFQRAASRRPGKRGHSAGMAEGLATQSEVARLAGIDRQLVRHWAIQAGINVT